MAMTCISNLDIVFPVSIEEKILMGDVPSEDLPHLYNFRQSLSQTGDKPDILTNIPSSTRSSDTVLEPSTNGKDDLSNCTQVHPVNTPFPENHLPFTKNPSKETISKKNSLSTGILTFPSVECLNGEHFPGKTVTPDNIRTTLSQETLNIRKTSRLLDTCDPTDLRKPPSFSSCTELEHTGSGKITNTSDTKTISSIRSSASQYYDPNMEIDTKNYEESIEEGKIRDFAFVNRQPLSGEHAKECPAVSARLELPIYDLPLPSPIVKKSIQVPKYLYQDYIIEDMSSNKSLNERLSVVENWARRGLDDAFNRPANAGSVDIKDSIKGLEYGMAEMNEIPKRIYSLMRAANKLPDPESVVFHKFERGKNRIRGDLISTGITMWHALDDIKLQVFRDYQKLKIICDILEKSTLIANSMKQDENPKILITNAYTLVIDKLPLLRRRMEEFCKNIRAFCSKVEQLL